METCTYTRDQHTVISITSTTRSTQSYTSRIASINMETYCTYHIDISISTITNHIGRHGCMRQQPEQQQQQPQQQHQQQQPTQQQAHESHG